MADDIYAWDPDNKSSLITLSNFNRTATKTGGGAWVNVKGLQEMASGKWYWEICYDSIDIVAGVSSDSGIAPSTVATTVRLGGTVNDIVFEEWRSPTMYRIAGAETAYGVDLDETDTLMVAYDAGAGKIWFGKNGTWMESGDPASGINECESGFTGTQLPAWGTYGAPNQVTIKTTASLCLYTAPTGFSYLTPPAYYFSGYVYEQGSPIQRTLFLHNRNDGSLLDTTTSSGNGYYYLSTSYSGSHYIVCLDDEAGSDYNDLIIGNVLPTTVSG